MFENLKIHGLKFSLFSLLLVIFLCHTARSVAQNTMAFQTIGIAQGLSQSTVFAIAEDSLGFMWFGTRDGLNRYDGYHFQILSASDQDTSSIVCDDIRVLYADQTSNSLWIGTRKGLSQLRLNTYATTNYFHDPDRIQSLSSNYITSIYRDKSSRLWVGTDAGLNLYTNDNTWERFYALGHELSDGFANAITTIFEDHSGNLWIGTRRGIFHITLGAGSRSSMNEANIIDSLGSDLSNNYIIDIVEDSTGIWIGTRSGNIYAIDHSTRSVKHLVNLTDPVPSSVTINALQSFHIDQQGMLWIGTLRGLFHYDPNTRALRTLLANGSPESISGNSIRSIAEDQNGGIWLGIYNGGINYYNRKNNRFSHYSPQPGLITSRHELISCFHEDSTGSVFIGHEEGGLSNFHPDENVFTIPPIQERFIKSSEVPRVKKISSYRNEIFIGSYRGGLYRYDRTSNQYSRYCIDCPDHVSLSSNNVYDIDIINNALWLGTYGGGINMIHLESDHLEYIRHDPDDSTSLSSDLVRSILQDSWGRIWIGTEEGLDLIRNTGGDELQCKHVLPGQNIYTLQEDRAGALWIGTFSNGLFRYNDQIAQFEHYTVKEGLPSNSISGIEEDSEGYLWISTSRGIARLDQESGYITNFGIADGLKNLEFNYNASIQLANGDILFGGRKGFTRFNPLQIKQSHYRPNLVLTSLSIQGQPVDLNHPDQILRSKIHHTKSLTLRLQDAVFEVGFAALDFFNPENHQYAYRLVGLEDNWNTTRGESHAKYTVQNPGRYTLEIDATTSTGARVKHPIALSLHVLPPLHRTWWACTIYIIFLMAFAYFLISQFKLKHRLKYEILSKQSEQKIHELRTRFFVNITHELRTPLTLISGPISKLMKDYQEDAVLVKQLAQVQKNSQRLLKLVSQLLTFQKLEAENGKVNLVNQDIVAFIEETFYSFADVARLRSIRYDLNTSIPTLVVPFDRDKIAKVMTNLLSNAFKFTDDFGSISVDIGSVENAVEISVQDSGKGIKSEHKDLIFKRFYELEAPPEIGGTGIGLSICKDLIALHGGEIWVESKVGQGSTFRFRIPKVYSGPISARVPEPEVSISSVQQKSTIAVEGSVDKPSNPRDRSRILLVDDNKEIATFLTSILEDQYSIMVVFSALECLRQVKSFHPSLIICDILMPEMDGMELCRQLKNDIETSHIPVIFLTAKATIATKLEGLNLGAEDFMTKPFDPEELKMRVKNLITSRSRIYQRLSRVMKIEPRMVHISSRDEIFLDKAISIVEKHIDDFNFNVVSFAYEMAVSRASLFEKIKRITSMTPNAFIKSIRLKRAAQFLSQGKNVAEVSYEVGFKDPKYFAKCFSKHFGISPSKYAESLIQIKNP